MRTLRCRPRSGTIFSYTVEMSLSHIMPFLLQNYPDASSLHQNLLLGNHSSHGVYRWRLKVGKLIFSECLLCSRHWDTTFFTYIILASWPHLLICLSQMERIQNFIMRSHALSFGLESNPMNLGDLESQEHRILELKGAMQTFQSRLPILLRIWDQTSQKNNQVHQVMQTIRDIAKTRFLATYPKSHIPQSAETLKNYISSSEFFLGNCLLHCIWNVVS